MTCYPTSPGLSASKWLPWLRVYVAVLAACTRCFQWVDWGEFVIITCNTVSLDLMGAIGTRCAGYQLLRGLVAPPRSLILKSHVIPEVDRVATGNGEVVGRIVDCDGVGVGVEGSFKDEVFRVRMVKTRLASRVQIYVLFFTIRSSNQTGPLHDRV